MSKYHEKQLTNASTMINDPDTPINIRKGSAGVLSPVFNSLVNAQMVYSGSQLQNAVQINKEENSYNDVVKLLPGTTGGSMEQSDTDSQPQRHLPP